MSRCDFTEMAWQDLREIHAYVARNNLGAAARLIDRLEKTCWGLAEMPGKGRQREEFGPGLRSFTVAPYLIFYREIENGVEIVRVLHGARKLDDLLS